MLQAEQKQLITDVVKATMDELHQRMPRPSVITYSQAAVMLGKSINTVRNWAKRGTIRTVKGGIPIAEIDRLLNA